MSATSATPAARPPRLAVAPDGSRVAQLDVDRIVLLDDELTVTGEIGTDPDADACELALCGDPLRLVVLSRYASSCRVHAIDPAGPDTVGELALRAPMRLAAAAGDHVWLIGAGGSTLVDVIHRELVPSPLPLRAAVAAVGRASNGRFLVSTGGGIEEWDPETRAPSRRFRLPRPLAAQLIGGGARQLWLVPTEGDRIELVALMNVGQPARIELPEPIVRIDADATHESVAAIGASGAVYIIDLAGRTPPTALAGVIAADVAWLGTSSAVVVVAEDGRLERHVVPGRVRAPTADRSPAPAPRPAPPRATMLTGAAPGPALDGPVADRLVQWRERVRTSAPTPPATTGWTTAPAPPGWRDRVATWARSVLSGTSGDAPTLVDGPAPVVAERLGLPDELAEVMWLIYGAHLGGVDGVAPLDLVPLIGRRWDELLGHGRLASSGALRWRRSRIVLRAEVLAALDEAPIAGTRIDSAALPPPEAVAIIASAGVDLIALATWIAPQLGPLLIADDHGRTDRHLREARVRGALAVLRWPPPDHGPDAAVPVALLVVADEATARAAQVTVIGTWPPPP